MVYALRDSEGQSAFENKKIYARYFLAFFSGRNISSIGGDELLNSIPTHSSKNKKPMANATKNRYRSFIMRAFSMAIKSGWIARVPHVPSLREPKVRVRWIEKHQARILIENLQTDWMKAICSFALLTGARKGEILSLRWANVDLGRKIVVIAAEDSKSGRARPLPLNDEAVKIMRNLPRESEYAFSRDGNKVEEMKRDEFYKALKLSGISDFRFHDFRHTWASWHVQNGTPLMTLKELGGWEKLEMVNKYAHLSDEHLSRFSGIVTFLAHDGLSEKSTPSISLVS